MFNAFKQSFNIYTMHSLYSSFDSDASNNSKLLCFEMKHTKQCYTISKSNLQYSGYMYNGTFHQTAET